MLTAVAIRRDEREQLFRMIEDYWREGPNPRRLFGNDVSVRDKRFDDEVWAEHESRFLWWAKFDEAPIGFAKTELVDDPLWDTQGDISHFYIARSFRRQGYGKAFVRLLFDWFEGKGVKSVRLFVRSDNPGGFTFWTNEGFASVQTWYQMRRTVR
jgi:ribosomal protein S18 acetylase RimI-like enzyme